ncbi:hypothetical protein ACR3K2_16180 [Cryptosporidium serpentis]
MGELFWEKFKKYLIKSKDAETKNFEKVVKCHLMMLISIISQIISLILLRTTKIEPWILLAGRSFASLTFLSILSLFFKIRDPLPFDFSLKVCTYSNSLKTILVGLIYSLLTTLDGSQHISGMLVAIVFVLIGYSLDIKYKFDHLGKKRISKLYLFSFVSIMLSICFSYPEILKLDFIRKYPIYSPLFLLLIFGISLLKFFSYSSLNQIDLRNITILEVLATNISDISKLSIPIGICVHLLRMKLLLPSRQLYPFMIDLLRFSKSSALIIFIASFLSFGLAFTLQLKSVRAVSVCSYTLYSSCIYIILSKSFIGIFLMILSLIIQIYNDISYIKSNNHENEGVPLDICKD